MATRKTSRSGGQKAISAIAGPGQMPDMPQPIPNSAAPSTSGASMWWNSGSLNSLANTGALRRRPIRTATNMTAIAGTMTKARLGSHPPLGMAVKSRNRSTFSGSTIWDTYRPAPKRRPLSAAVAR